MVFDILHRDVVVYLIVLCTLILCMLYVVCNDLYASNMHRVFSAPDKGATAAVSLYVTFDRVYVL